MIAIACNSHGKHGRHLKSLLLLEKFIELEIAWQLMYVIVRSLETEYKFNNKTNTGLFDHCVCVFWHVLSSSCSIAFNIACSVQEAFPAIIIAQYNDMI